MLIEIPQLARYHWRPCLDVSEEGPIPPFAILKPMRVRDDGVVEVDQYDGTETTPFVPCFNGPWTIPEGAYGQCTFSAPCWVAFTGAPVAGEIWGPEGGTWKIKKGKKGLVIIGDAVKGTSADRDRCMVDAEGGSASLQVARIDCVDLDKTVCTQGTDNAKVLSVSPIPLWDVRPSGPTKDHVELHLKERIGTITLYRYSCAGNNLTETPISVQVIVPE